DRSFSRICSSERGHDWSNSLGHRGPASCGLLSEVPHRQLSRSRPAAPDIDWLYNKDASRTFTDVRDGEVQRRSPRAARLSLYTNCSLIINEITAEDAGRHICRYLEKSRDDTHQSDCKSLLIIHVPLFPLSTDISCYLLVSPSSTDIDPNKDGEVTLSCSMFKYEQPCKPRSLRWVDETGAELVGEGDGFKYERQANCVSYLTVKLQTEHSRRYTCQYVDGTGVKIEAHYSTVSSLSPTGEDSNTLNL
uniref:Ig-like domain-containing protein n=1 Tax=Salarias fasciatus TaxID=181472 RepID=A0A672H7N3_SALFA